MRYTAKEVHFDSKRFYHDTETIPEMEELVNKNRKRDRGQIAYVFDNRACADVGFVTKNGVFKIVEAKS